MNIETKLTPFFVLIITTTQKILKHYVYKSNIDNEYYILINRAWIKYTIIKRKIELDHHYIKNCNYPKEYRRFRHKEQYQITFDKDTIDYELNKNLFRNSILEHLRNINLDTIIKSAK